MHRLIICALILPPFVLALNMSELDDYHINSSNCSRPASCQPLNQTTCFGVRLPYQSTTLELTGANSFEDVQEKLMAYQYLRNVPKCWIVIQPFLCALYMPKCKDAMVYLPSREMCRVTSGPCKILYNSSIFPEFMNCDKAQLYPANCKNDIHT